MEPFSGAKFASEDALFAELADIFVLSGNVASAMGAYYGRVAEASVDPSNDQLTLGFSPVAKALGTA